MKNQNDILKDILNNNLDLDDELELWNSDYTKEKMKKEWAFSAEEGKDHSFDSSRIKEQIEFRLFGEKRTYSITPQLKLAFLAASLLCGVFISGLFWLLQKPTIQKEEFYVWTSGKQNIESIVLSDGTAVMLGPESRLSYPKVFDKNNRKVELEGQGFFDVSHNPDQPFIVATEQMEVTALGTAFEVFSYSFNETNEATLLNGSVKVLFRGTEDKIGENILSPNQKISKSKTNEVKIETVDAEKYLSWSNKKKLSFIDEKLSVIIPRLEVWYDKKIRCDEDLASHYRFTFTVDDESFIDIVEFINRVSVLTVNQNNGVYEIVKKH